MIMAGALTGLRIIEFAGLGPGPFKQLLSNGTASK